DASLIGPTSPVRPLRAHRKCRLDSDADRFLTQARLQPRKETPMTRSTRNRTARPRRHTLRPRLDSLEERALLSTITWAADVSGDWDNPAMWTGGVLPGPGDDVSIPFADITVTHGASTSDTVNTLTSQADIVISSGSLGVASTSTVNNSLTL